MKKQKKIKGWAIVFSQSGELDTTDVMQYEFQTGKNIPDQIAFSIFPRRRDAIVYKRKWISIDLCKVVPVEITFR